VQLHGCERWLAAQAATAAHQNSGGKTIRMGKGSMRTERTHRRRSSLLVTPGQCGAGLPQLRDIKAQTKPDAAGATRLQELAIEAMSKFVNSVGATVADRSEARQAQDSGSSVFPTCTELCIHLLHTVCSPLMCEGDNVRQMTLSFPDTR
jgi:hypothetical protein